MSLAAFPRLIIIFLCLGLSSFSPAVAAGDNTAIPYGHNKATGRYADINGIRMYYEIYGHGTPLVLIHGNGDSIAGMAAQISYFSKDYKVIVADSRGHGKSGLGTDHLNYVQMMEDWNALLDKLHVSHADVFGWSDGGILGLLLAINHPDKIAKLAVMGANLRPDATAVEPWAAPMLKEYAKEINKMIAEKDTSLDWNLEKQRLGLEMTQPDIKPENLHRIKIPVLVMAGDRDVIRAEHSLEIFHNLENAQLLILPGHTHFAPVNDPKTVNAFLGYFFKHPFTKPSTKEIIEKFYDSAG